MLMTSSEPSHTTHSGRSVETLVRASETHARETWWTEQTEHRS